MQHNPLALPVWISPVIKLSGFICIIAGVWHILSSGSFLSFLSITMPAYQPYMSWIGIMMAVLGMVSVAISYNPLQAINIIIILFFAKLIISIKLLVNVYNQEISMNFMLVILLIDTLWIPVYGVIIYNLLAVWRSRASKPVTEDEAFGILSQLCTQEGHSLHELSAQRPLLLVFLRNLRCLYSSKVFDDVGRQIDQIKSMGYEVVFVHMSSEIAAMNVFKKFNADHYARVSDPEQKLYTLSQLYFSCFRQFICPRFLLSMLLYFIINKNSRSQWGNPIQMNGYSILYKNRILFNKCAKYITQNMDYIESIRQVENALRKINDKNAADGKNETDKIVYFDFTHKNKPYPRNDTH